MTRAIRTLLILTALGFVPVAASADPIVVPSSLAAVEGNSNNGLPFNLADFTFLFNSLRYQQVYSAAEFGLSPILIDAVWFRPDSGDFGEAFSTTIADVQINLSTTTGGPDTLSSTFADNVGADNIVVRSGSLSFSSADVPGPGTTRDFDIFIPFTTPFLYNPALGNLLLDVRMPNVSDTTQFDAEFSTDSVSRVFSDVNESTGQTDTLGLVTKFRISAVPDGGSALALLGLGMIGLSTLRRKLL